MHIRVSARTKKELWAGPGPLPVLGGARHCSNFRRTREPMALRIRYRSGSWTGRTGDSQAGCWNLSSTQIPMGQDTYRGSGFAAFLDTSAYCDSYLSLPL